MKPPTVFFNSSLPRSGSTALQNILAQNPRFYCSTTSGVSTLLLEARKRMRVDEGMKAGNWELNQKGWLGFCRGSLEGFYATVTGKPCVVDKSRDWLPYHEWVEAFYPNPKMLVMVRELGAIVASMEKLFRRKRYLGDPTEDSGAMATVEQRVGQWMSANPVGTTLMGIKDAIDRGIGDRVLFIRYEDLAASPARELGRIYDYLGEKPFRHDFDNVKQLVPENDASYGIYGDHQIRPGRIEPPPSDARAILGDGPCNYLADNHLWFYDKFGYPPRP